MQRLSRLHLVAAVGLVAASLQCAACGGGALGTDSGSGSDGSAQSSDLSATAPPDMTPARDLTPLPDLTVVPDLVLTREQACDDFVTAYCQKLAQCAPIISTTQYGDAATCASRIQLVCGFGLSPLGQSPTPAQSEACAQDLLSLGCDDLFLSNLPASCAPMPGKKLNGTGCVDATDCQSTFCGKPVGAACGTCGPKPTVGSDCSHIPCGDSLNCAPASMTCVAKGLLHATCATDDNCIASLSCQGASATAMGSCETRLAAGVACDPAVKTTAGCNSLIGLFCNGATKICQSVSYADAGAACGLVNGGYTVCKASAVCRTNGAASGTCVATAADGTSCNETNGPACLPPAVCYNSVCVLPSVLPNCP